VAAGLGVLSPPWTCPDGRCMMIMVMSNQTKPSRGVGESGAVSPSYLSSGRGLHCIYHILLVRSVRSTAYLESSSRGKDNTSDWDGKSSFAMAQHFPRAHANRNEMEMGWKEDWMRGREGKAKIPPALTLTLPVHAAPMSPPSLPSRPMCRPHVHVHVCLSVCLSVWRICMWISPCHTANSTPVIAQRRKKKKTTSRPSLGCPPRRTFLFSLGIMYHRKGWPGRVSAMCRICHVCRALAAIEDDGDDGRSSRKEAGRTCLLLYDCTNIHLAPGGNRTTGAQRSCVCVVAIDLSIVAMGTIQGPRYSTKRGGMMDFLVHRSATLQSILKNATFLDFYYNHLASCSTI
jgi:hypothetical protein